MPALKSSQKLFLYLVLTVLFIHVHSTAYAATGKIFLNYSSGTIEVSSDFSVAGRYIVNSDDTICHLGQGLSYGSQLRYKIDGNDKGSITNIQALGVESGFSIPISISEMDKSKEHEVLVYLEDIYGIWVYYSPDDLCADAGVMLEKPLKFRIKIPQSCELKNVPAGSTVNVNTGVLSDNQQLFSVKGNSPLGGLSLYYTSQNAYPASIGSGWKHSYEHRLIANADGNMVLAEPDGSTRFYQPSGSNYVTKDGDTSLLVRSTDGSFTVTEADSSSMTFSSSGKIISTLDRDGKSLIFNYDANNDLSEVVDQYQRKITFAYDTTVTPHRLTHLRDPNMSLDQSKPHYTLEYDAIGRLFHVVYPVTDDGIAAGYWEFSYKDDTNLLATKRDPNNNLTTYTYENGRLIGSIDPDGTADPQGHTRSIGYPTNSNNVRCSTLTEKDGGNWSYKYDITTGRLLQKAPGDCSAPDLVRATNYTYYSSTTDKSRYYTLRMSKTEPGTNGIRYTVFYTYDANGNVITETPPVNLASYTPPIDPATVTDPATLANLTPPINPAFRYAYEPNGKNRILTSSDERDAAHFLTTSYNYSTDAEGYEVTTVTEPSGATTVTRQFTDGRTKDTTDANGKKTSYTYRSDGLTESVTDPAGVITFYSDYDANGNNTQMKIKDTDVIVRKTIDMEYDARNRLRASTTTTADNPDGFVTAYDYDANDNMTVTDAEDNQTRYEYNYNRQVTKIRQQVTDPVSGQLVNVETSYRYSGSGCPSCGGGVDKLIEVRDARQTADASKLGTSYRYDQLGRLERETDPLSKVIRYTYHDNGLVKEKYDATGGDPGTLLVTYSYDNSGRLLNKHYGSGAPTFAPPDEGYTYDSNGRLATAYNADIKYKYDYYADGKNVGRLQTVTDITDPANPRVIVSYDDYDNRGQKAQVTVIKGAGADERVTKYEYDDKNRPWKITSNNGTTNARTYEYKYDKLSRRENLLYRSPTPDITTNYAYDNLDRMTTVTHVAGTTTIAFANYSSFDNVGNRKKKTTASGTESYVYDELYRLLRTVSPKGTEIFNYDAVGNRVSGPGVKDTAYQHNNGNQMTRGRRLGYDYDNMGNQYNRSKAGVSGKSWALNWDKENRLKSIVKTVGNEICTTVAFKYDPFGRRIEKSLTTTCSGTPERTWTYVYDDDKVALEIYKVGTTEEKTYYIHGINIDEHLAMERSGQFYYFLADGLGSIVAITNGNGSVVQSYEYDSFGMVKPSTGFRNSYTYTGREWDKETGLYYYRARYYDPMEGRFISKDPSSFSGGDVNLYGYTANNPINMKDPSGLFTVTGNCCGKEKQIKNELNNACKVLVQKITDPELRSCVQKSCEESKVSCGNSSCMDSTLLGESVQGFGSFKFRNITLCICNFSTSNFGEVAVHEWAHGCGWRHGNGKGVPGDNGKANY